MRTYRTLSLSLSPTTFQKLDAIGKATGRTGARVATEIVIAAINGPEAELPPARGRRGTLEDRVLALEAELTAVKALLLLLSSSLPAR